MTMWQAYRRRFWTTQIVIALTLVALWFVTRSSPDAPKRLAIYLVVLEIFSLLGSWWGTRLGRKIQKAEDKLPLEK